MYANTAFTTQTIQGPQGKLQLLQSGNAAGSRLLFLHADGGCAGQWREVMALLADEFETCALDFRGHGGSEAAVNGDYSFQGRAEDALAAADALGWQRFLVVAHSGGCAAALALAGKHAGRVSGLVLADPTTDPRAIPKEAFASMLAGLAGSDSLAFLKQYYLAIAGADRAIQARVLADADATTAASRAGLGTALIDWNPEQALDGYGGPMVMLGTDITDGPSALHALRPGIAHRVVHGTGHWLQLERPGLLADTIREVARTGQRHHGNEQDANA